MKSIFNNTAYLEILSRLETLSDSSQAQWGSMNTAQMMVHCRSAIEVALGKKTLEKPNILKGTMLKLMKGMLYNDTPWRHGLPTAKEFVIIDTKTFETEKTKLKQCIEEIHASEDFFKPSKVHPFFGRFTADQWGKSIYKHLDHHLRQFGV